METREDRPRISRDWTTTHWNRIRAAGSGAHEALAELCDAYREPIHAFLRWKWAHGNEEEARELTQGFFLRLLEKNHELLAVDQRKGKFRSWLRAAACNYCKNLAKRARAAKHGGDAPHVPLGADEPEPAYDPTLEPMLDRPWALTLLGRALGGIRDDYAGREPEFEKLTRCLVGDDDRTQAQMAGELGVEPGTFRVRVVRFKEKFGKRIREEIAQTVSDEAQIDEEIGYLRAVFQASPSSRGLLDHAPEAPEGT